MLTRPLPPDVDANNRAILQIASQQNCADHTEALTPGQSHPWTAPDSQNQAIIPALARRVEGTKASRGAEALGWGEAGLVLISCVFRTRCWEASTLSPTSRKGQARTNLADNSASPVSGLLEPVALTEPAAGNVAVRRGP